MRESKNDLSAIIDLADTAAIAAGKLITEMRTRELKTRNKARFDLVTDADVAAEKLIVQKILARFPEHAILAEENYKTVLTEQDALAKLSRGPLWIIDPIDGTTNYALGHVHCCVSIGYAFDGQLQVGAVEAPFLQESYRAVREKGATLNGMQLRVHDLHTPDDAVISTGIGPGRKEELDQLMCSLQQLLRRFGNFRRLGSVALDLCWLASGKLHGHFETGLKPWDIAAAKLVALEAGAKWGSVHPLPDPLPVPEELYAADIIAGVPGIFEELKKSLRS
jgi:myo-inositol-1(or 4)-monophosphatase